MTKYIPFLKLKRNEIIALGALDADVKPQITPFFDSPKKKMKEGETPEKVFKKDTLAAVRSFELHLQSYDEIYTDNYDIDDMVIEGEHSYSFFLKAFDAHPVIPVVGVDRTPEYIASISALKSSSELQSDTLALRLTPEDFIDYTVVSFEIDELLGGLIEQFENIDLLFDCRVCSEMDSNTVSNQIQNFAESFIQEYQNTRKIVITGSSIPASVRDILPTDSDSIVERKEIEIFTQTASESNLDFIFGDYTVISPDYSDVDISPQMMQNVMTPKFVYSFQDKHYFIRGKGLKQHGYEQYFNLAESLCSQFFFRGADYSQGDNYIHQKSQSLGSNCAPGTVVNPLVNAHIIFTVRELLD